MLLGEFLYTYTYVCVFVYTCACVYICTHIYNQNNLYNENVFIVYVGAEDKSLTIWEKEEQIFEYNH